MGDTIQIIPCWIHMMIGDKGQWNIREVIRYITVGAYYFALKQPNVLRELEEMGYIARKNYLC